MTDALDPVALRQAFGAYPSGVVALAAEVGGRPVGLAASSFTSVSLDPALASFSVARTSSTWPRLREATRLGISVLAEHHDRVCRQLAGPADDRFEGLSLHTSDERAVYLRDAVAWFECSVEREVDAGDHLLVLLHLHAIGDSGAEAPLVFHRSGFRRLGEEAPLRAVG